MEKTLTLKWVVAEEKIIRFEESADVYDLDAAVGKQPFLKQENYGKKFVVNIEAKPESKGVVSHMKLVEGDTQAAPAPTTAPTTETKPEQPKTETANPLPEIFTVSRIVPKTNGMQFKELEGKWYTLSKSISVDSLKGMGIDIGSRVGIEVKMPDNPKYNPIITNIAAVKVAEDTMTQGTTQVTNDAPKQYVDPKSSSIEAQAAVKAANMMIGSLFQGKADASDAKFGETVRALVTALSKHNYKVIQEIKSQKD